MPLSRSANEADIVPQMSLQMNQLIHLCAMLSYDPMLHRKPAPLASSFSAPSRSCPSRTCLSHVSAFENSVNSLYVFVDYFDYFETVWLPSCPFELRFDSWLLPLSHDRDLSLIN